jgi:hypothetical protein
MASAHIYFRDIALRAQGSRCFYCKAPLSWWSATADHKHPKSKRGRLREDNIVAACEPCNQAKGNLFSEQFFTLIKKPRPPKARRDDLLLVWATRRIWRRTHRACDRIERFAGALTGTLK